MSSGSKRSLTSAKCRPCSFHVSSVVGPSSTYMPSWPSKETVFGWKLPKSAAAPVAFSKSEIERKPSEYKRCNVFTVPTMSTSPLPSVKPCGRSLGV